jgi:hypothetical protein
LASATATRRVGIPKHPTKPKPTKGNSEFTRLPTQR